MGLFENIQKRARKLGITDRALYALPYISLLAAICGVAWLLALPIKGQYRDTYISENALLPGQATTQFRETEWHIARGYREEVHLLEHANDETKSDTVLQWFEDIGLRASKHQWEMRHGDEVKNGTNVYAIMHAPRGDNTEAMVVVAPWLNEFGEFNDGGVTLVVALARFFKRWTLWSKNIIFVITSDSQFAVRSWVEAYHTTLEHTAGSIEAAVVLDYPNKSDYFDYVEVFYEGLNGQLPNLDLVNVATLVAGHEHVKMVVQEMNVPFNKYWERALTLLSGIYRQVVCGIQPGPGGENFSGWRIDTVTLRARGTQGPTDITHFGRLAESICRSINNLLEHFHQSFFFYFLLAPRKFVSIGTYLPSAMLTANSFTLMAIYLLLTSSPSATLGEKTLKPILILVSVFSASLLFGYITLSIPTSSAPKFIQGVSALSYFAPAVIRILQSKIRISRAVLQHLQAYSLLLHGLFLTTLATTNFSLSLAIALFTLPMAWIRPGVKTNVPTSLLALSSPWTGILALSYFTRNIHGNGGDWGASYDVLVRGVLWGWRGLQVWTWWVIVGLWLPAWIVGLIVATVGVSENKDVVEVVTEEKKNS